MNTKLKYWIAAVALIVWLVLAWFIGSWLHLQGSSLWILRIALALIGIAAFIIVIWWFRVKDKEREQMTAGGGAAGDEIDILIREAEMRLQASQLGRSAKFGSLPLYLVMGETGSAKTSVVLHSGLEPELLAGHTVQDKVPVPTRTANLWYTRQFIFAEAGGPMLQDRARWAKFVKKLAPRQLHSIFGKGTPSPRAALVCVDSETFMKAGAPEALAASTEKIRTRLREVSQLLGITLPVYVLFTRADRLQFFHDYVRNLTNDEASVVLGATLPKVTYSTGVYAEQETARISREFDNLFQSLADRRVNLLSQEFDAAKLPPIYEFPREFRKVRTSLAQMLVDLCRPSQLRTGPFLRGFYFSGVRPVTITTAGPTLAQDEPVAQPSASTGEVGATGIFDIRKARAIMAQQQARAPEASETRRVPQWVFLPHLFSDVLLKDTSALTASASSTKTSLWRRILLATATAFLLIFIVGFIVSFVRNKNLESQVVTAAQGIPDVQLTGQELPSLDMLNKLETLRQSVETLSDYQQNGPPFSMRWGLYVGNSLYPDVRRIYFQHFQQLLFGQAQSNLVKTLSSLPGAPGPNDQYEAAYNPLKAYLITTSNHEKSTSLFLSPVLMKAWAGGRDIDQDRVQLAQKQFDFYSEQLKIENPYSSEYDTLVVAKARNYLSQFSGVERVYRFVLAEAEKANPSINFNKKFPGSAEVVVDRVEVSGAFTKGGWAFIQNALQNLPKFFSGEQWVLGEETSSNVDLTKIATDLRSRYQQDYIEQWRTFLRNGNVVRYGGLADAAQKLLKLSGNQSPLLALMCITAQNTVVDQPDVVKAFQPVQAVVSPNCQDQYIGDANKPYVAGLSGLQSCLDKANSTPGDKEAAKAQCAGDASNAQQAANQIAQGFKIDQDGHVDQTVQNLLLAPIVSIAAVLKPGPVSGQGLCAQLNPLESKFPFAPQATLEATPQDLALVFDPTSGALAQFYNSALKNLLLPQATGYIVNPAATQPVNPAFLNFFNRAAGVQHALYAGAPGQLQFKYALRPHPTESVSSLSMNIDGQVMNYSGGNSSYQQFTWPGITGQGVTLTIKIAGGSELTWPSYNGTWGVFHFFDDADKAVQNGSVYNVEWILRVAGGRPVTAPNGKPVTVQFDLDTLGAPPILQKSFFSTMRCVSSVTR
ncbi:MAG: ImcF-related family protein [Terriglobia bacterium]|jgi:type VI secretion system protein ImpL